MTALTGQSSLPLQREGVNKKPNRAMDMSINIKPSHRGLLHRSLGVPQGEPIPQSKVESAENSSDRAVRKRAVFAENAKHWNHSGKRRSIGQRITDRGK